MPRATPRAACDSPETSEQWGPTLPFRAGSRAAQGPVSRATPRFVCIRTCRTHSHAPIAVRPLFHTSLSPVLPTGSCACLSRAHASELSREVSVKVILLRVRMLQNSTWVFYYFFGHGQKSGLCIGRGQKSALCIGFRWKSGPSPPLRDAPARTLSQKASSRVRLRFEAPQGDFRTYTQSRFLASTYTQSRFLARSGARGKSVRLRATRNLSATDPLEWKQGARPKRRRGSAVGAPGVDRRGARNPAAEALETRPKRRRGSAVGALGSTEKALETRPQRRKKARLADELQPLNSGSTFRILIRSAAQCKAGSQKR